MGVRENECEVSKNCETQVLKISCVRYNFVNFGIRFLGLPEEIFFCVITED